MDFGLRKNLSCLNKDTRVDPSDGDPAGPGRDPDPSPDPEAAAHQDDEGAVE